MNVGELGEEGVSELERLQGVNTSNAEAFADEGVTTILQLAYSDPIDLTIRTSLGFSYVVDCVSQALAWIYFEDELKTLRKHSLRGAQEIASFISELDDSKDRKAQARAKAALQQIAQELQKQPESLERTFREIAEDPYTQFLWNAWQ
jgi:predicted flap endonuclease-1-like 5' DNA nuclease